MRLIDADALKALVTQRHDFFRGCTNAPEKARRDELLQVMCDINEQPDVDAVPVVHGEWKWSHGGECSECGFHNSNFDYRYCPNCGAKMDGERRDDP